MSVSKRSPKSGRASLNLDVCVSRVTWVRLIGWARDIESGRGAHIETLPEDQQHDRYIATCVSRSSTLRSAVGRSDTQLDLLAIHFGTRLIH